MRPVLLFRPVGFQRQAGGTGKQEVPSHAQQKQSHQKLLQIHARQRNCNTQRVQSHADRHDRQRAKTPYQMPGEEARGKHANHVPLQDQRRVLEWQVANLHCKWSGRHQQIHHPVTERGPQRGHYKDRLADDFAQRPPTRCTRHRLRDRRKRHQTHQHHRNQRNQRQRQIGTRKRNR